MTQTSHRDLCNVPLEPRLLSTPYHVQTNWYVITGAPCCGKTTQIDLLSEKSYQTVPESSRIYLEREVAKGRKFEEIYGNHDDARNIRDLIQRTEQALQANDLLFLDRALPDCFAFYRTMDMNPNEYLAPCFQHRYAGVFILDRLPLQLDGIRVDDDFLGDYVDQWLERDYAALGYTVIRVPVLPPQERHDFILEAVEKEKR